MVSFPVAPKEESKTILLLPTSPDMVVVPGLLHPGQQGVESGTSAVLPRTCVYGDVVVHPLVKPTEGGVHVLWQGEEEESRSACAVAEVGGVE